MFIFVGNVFLLDLCHELAYKFVLFKRVETLGGGVVSRSAPLALADKAGPRGSPVAINFVLAIDEMGFRCFQV